MAQERLNRIAELPLTSEEEIGQRVTSPGRNSNNDIVILLIIIIIRAASARCFPA